MDEICSPPAGDEPLGPAAERDELSLRRAIHDLGNRDYEARATARTYVLSAGEIAVPILLRALEEDKQRSREIAQRVALVVAAVVLAGPALGVYLNKTWLVVAGNIGACLILLAACLLFTRPAWYSEAAKLLSRYHSPEVTHAMIDSLVDVWGEEQPRLRAAIIQRLASIRPTDSSWLKGETRERVIALVSMPDWSSPVCVDHVLIIARALATIGATEALPVLRGLNCDSLQGERCERLKSGLNVVIAQLEALAGQRKPADELLRAAHQDGVALVRPAESSPQADPALLVRSVGEPDATTTESGDQA